MNNEEITAALRALLPEGLEAELPPPVIVELGLYFTDYLPGTAMTARCPAARKTTGPFGIVQGGILGVALDAVYGTLAYLEMKQPCVSISMDLNFVRPLPGDGQEFEIRTGVQETTRNFILMDGRITNQAGKTIARSTTTMKLMG